MPPRHIDEATLHQREQEILDHALAIIADLGIIGLTMDKVVAKVSYSKGTVYNHFSSKEDLLAGLCNRNMKKVMELFLRAAAIDASGRDKMTAIGFAYMLSVLLSPQHFALVMNAKTELFEKASQARREHHDQLDDGLFGVMLAIIEDAINDNELTLQAHVDVQQVSFSMWAMAFGTIALLLNGEKACSTMTGMMLEDRVLAHSNMVMDGLGWSASTRDQKEFINWLKSDVFTEEINQLDKQGIHLRAP